MFIKEIMNRKLTKYQSTAFYSCLPNRTSNIFKGGKSIHKTGITTASKETEEAFRVALLHLIEVWIELILWGACRWRWWRWWWRAWGGSSSTAIPDRENNHTKYDDTDSLHISLKWKKTPNVSVSSWILRKNSSYNFE